MTNYAAKGHYYIDEPRFELRYLMPFVPDGAQVLDIGAGNGNNAMFFLERGYKVTAVEPNPGAIAVLRRLQKQFPHNLTIVQASLDSYKPSRQFDVVLCCMVVHFMEGHAPGVGAILSIQSWTKPGGVNLVTGYVGGQPLPQEYSFLLEPGELAGLYRGWRVCWSEESFRVTLRRMRRPQDAARLVLGRRGYRAARIIAQKLI